MRWSFQLCCMGISTILLEEHIFFLIITWGLKKELFLCLNLLSLGGRKKEIASNSCCSNST